MGALTRPSGAKLRRLYAADLVITRLSFFLEQGQKISTSIDDAFDPNGFPYHPKSNHIPSHNCHSRALANFGPQLVEQRVSCNRTNLRADLPNKAFRPRWIVLRDVVGNRFKIAFHKPGEFHPHYLTGFAKPRYFRSSRFSTGLAGTPGLLSSTAWRHTRRSSLIPCCCRTLRFCVQSRRASRTTSLLEAYSPVSTAWRTTATISAGSAMLIFSTLGIDCTRSE